MRKRLMTTLLQCFMDFLTDKALRTSPRALSTAGTARPTAIDVRQPKNPRSSVCVTWRDARRVLSPEFKEPSYTFKDVGLWAAQYLDAMQYGEDIPPLMQHLLPPS